jgi:RND family efflux transporter MFP subunit
MPKMRARAVLRVLVALAGWAVLGTAASGAPALVPGVTEPVHDSLLSASVAGTVQIIHFKEGDSVAAGAVILELDKSLEELEVARRRSVYESRAELEAARHRAEVLQADYESTKRLFDHSQSVSHDEVEKKELDYKLAVAERDRLTAAKERERIELDIAREQLAHRMITAPFAGVITDIRVDLGVACEPHQPVVRVVELKHIYFVADIAPALTARLKPGCEVKLHIDVPTGQRDVRGTVDYLAPVVDPGSGLRRVKVIFENPDTAIAPGAVGRLELD